MQKWVEIARTGTFTDSAGRPQTFTEADLSAIASAYNPQKRDCPLVFGHPQSDSAPAYGWLSQIKAQGDKLLAQFARVPEQVRELVAKGHYRHVSMSLMPDRKTLRHVALLGAAQPAIDGLKAVELSQGGECITVDFSSSQGGSMTVEELQRQVGQLQAQLEALKTENTDLKKKAEAHKNDAGKAEAEKKAAQEKEAKTAADFAAYRGKVEGEKREARVSALVEAGKITPAEKAGVLEFAAALAAQGGSINFAAPDGKAETISLEEKYLREQEARQPDQRLVQFSAPPLHAADAGRMVEFNPADLTSKL